MKVHHFSLGQLGILCCICLSVLCAYHSLPERKMKSSKLCCNHAFYREKFQLYCLILQVQTIEENGGQTTLNGKRRRTPGGVLWNVLRSRYEEDYKAIMAAGKDFEVGLWLGILFGSTI